MRSPARLATAAALLTLAAPAAALAADVPLDDDPGMLPVVPLSPRQRLGELERHVAELKSKVDLGLMRLRALGQRVFHHDFGDGAQARLLHRSKMGPAYRLVSLTYSFDGRVVHQGQDVGGIDGRELPILDLPVAPGLHTIGVQLRYQGHDPLFTYVDGYRYTLRDARTLPFAAGKTTRVEVVARPTGDPLTTGVERRPTLDFQLRVLDE